MTDDKELLGALNDSGDGVADNTADDAKGLSTDGHLGGESETGEPRKLSVRDSIKEAIKEQSKTPEDRASERNRNLERAREVRAANLAARKSGSDVDTKVDQKFGSTVKPDDKAVSTSKPEFKPPNGWTKEARDLWNQLPESVKASVAKREQETSDGFKKYGEDSKRFQEIDSVIAPRRQAIQRLGVSEAQVVDRLFQWMEALTGPNAKNSWLALGQNFGIDVSSVTPTQGTQQPKSGQPPQQRSGAIPDEVKQYVEGAMGQVNQYLSSQREAAANDYLANWAKDKPYYQRVRGVMYGLLQSGTLPLKDGKLDLDGAYERAIYADPDIRSEIQQKEQQAAEEKAELERQKAEAAKIARITNARKAATSLKPTAHSPNTSKAAPRDRKPVSARDSIREAIAELMNN